MRHRSALKRCGGDVSSVKVCRWNIVIDGLTPVDDGKEQTGRQSILTQTNQLQGFRCRGYGILGEGDPCWAVL
jgi:hypothetical protein